MVGGDLNARTASNGDAETNAEGRELIHFAEEHMLRIVNRDKRKCRGAFTWERKRGQDMQQSTIDYVLCSKAHYRYWAGPLTRQSGIQDGVGSVAPGW